MKNDNLRGRTMPKYKGELRQGIIENISSIKNSMILKHLYILSDIMRRAVDDKEYSTLTDAEWDIYISCTDILLCENTKYLIRMRSFIHELALNHREKY